MSNEISKKVLGEAPIKEALSKNFILKIKDQSITWDKLNPQVVEKFYEIAQAVKNPEHYRGNWKSGELYYKNDTVYHLGCKWLCLKDLTKEEPTWYTSDWVYIMGDNQFSLVLSSSKGASFRLSNIDTNISTRIYFGSFDVTSKVLSQTGRSVSWTRDSNSDNDESWIPTYTDGTLLNIHISRYDVGNSFVTRGSTIFTITVKIPTSLGYTSAQQTVNIN